MMVSRPGSQKFGQVQMELSNRGAAASKRSRKRSRKGTGSARVSSEADSHVSNPIHDDPEAQEQPHEEPAANTVEATTTRAARAGPAKQRWLVGLFCCLLVESSSRSRLRTLDMLLRHFERGMHAIWIHWLLRIRVHLSMHHQGAGIARTSRSACTMPGASSPSAQSS